MGPTFHATTVVGHIPMFFKKAEELMDLWEETGGNNIDVLKDLSHFTIDTLGTSS